MFRADRSDDQEFRWHHLLYFRFKPEEVLGGRVAGTAIPYKNTSVNWSKYSKPWDVVFGYPNHAFGQFLVCALPSDLPSNPPQGDMKLHTFLPSHVPELDNYAHSEIWAYKDGVRVPNPNPGLLAKKEFRQRMSDLSFVLYIPENVS